MIMYLPSESEAGRVQDTQAIDEEEGTRWPLTDVRPCCGRFEKAASAALDETLGGPESCWVGDRLRSDEQLQKMVRGESVGRQRVEGKVTSQLLSCTFSILPYNIEWQALSKPHTHETWTCPKRTATRVDE